MTDIECIDYMVCYAKKRCFFEMQLPLCKVSRRKIIVFITSKMVQLLSLLCLCWLLLEGVSSFSLRPHSEYRIYRVKFASPRSITVSNLGGPLANKKNLYQVSPMTMAIFSSAGTRRSFDLPPVLTKKAVSSAIGYGLGDIVAQILFRKVFFYFY